MIGNLKIYKEFLQEKYSEQLESNIIEDTFKTGLLLYDEIIGGIPLGTIVNISSQAGAGKTTLMVQLQSYLQKQNQQVVYFDTEHSMSIQRMESLGLDKEKILYISPNTIEELYNIMLDLLKQKYKMEDKTPLVFLVDSMTAVPSIKELEDGVVTNQPGIKARVHSQQLPKILNGLQKTNSTMIMINQMRTNINMGMFSYGKPAEDMTGGVALKFYPSQDIRLRIGNQKDLEPFNIQGRKVLFKTEKNRFMSPQIEFPMILDFENGFVNDLSILSFLKVLTKEDWKKQDFDTIPFVTGGWYKINYTYKDKNDNEQTYEKTFRLGEFRELYNTDKEFRKIINSITITFIRRRYRQFDKDYFYLPDEEEDIYRDKIDGVTDTIDESGMDTNLETSSIE